MYKIEKNVPLIQPRGPKYKYPFTEMEIGDSIFVAGQNPQGGAAVAARAYGRRNTKTFATASYEGGIRIWRVK